MKHGGGHPGGRQVQAGLAVMGERWAAPAGHDHLLALDDTDNLESPGTGFRARELALKLAEHDLGRPLGITRHQLLVDDAIPYTSHNSSACIVLTGVHDAAAVFDLACAYLREAAAEGSDVGVVLVERSRVADAVADWGHRAKRQVLALDGARALAAQQRGAAGLRHAELSGTGGGLIGALAAVGLHVRGGDGRLLWLRGIRELAGQRLPVRDVEAQLGVQVQTCDGHAPTAAGEAGDIDLGDWPRAVYRGHRPVLLVEEHNGQDPGARWRCIDRERVKQLSS